MKINSKLYPLVGLILVCSCGVVKKKTTYSETKDRTITVKADTEPATASEQTAETTAPVTTSNNSIAEEIIGTALQFSGVRYKFGGTTRKGMDCSGLLYVAFKEHEVPLPRVSHQMADQGTRIKVKNVTKGDLLFFNTRRRGKRINHVGLVVEVKGDDIKFIHATSSRGVIVSSLREGYWNYAFVKATRVL